jgi:hypothetical protein
MALLGSFVNFLFVANSFFVIYKQVKSKTGLSSTKPVLAILFLLLMAADLASILRSNNYYKFMNIRRDFESAELQKATRNMLRTHHPDKTGNSGGDYLKAQEVSQILSDPKNKSIISIYNLYGEDLRTLFFDKFANKNIQVYRLEKQNSIWIDYYILLFLQLFMLKEIKRTNYRLKIACFATLTFCFGLESIVYDFYDMGQYQSIFYSLLDHFHIFSQLTLLEALCFFKRTIVWAWLLTLFVYLSLLRKRTGINTEGVSEKILLLKSNNQHLSKDSANALNEELEKKIAKRLVVAKKIERTQTIVILVCSLYFFANYFKIY